MQTRKDGTLGAALALFVIFLAVCVIAYWLFTFLSSQRQIDQTRDVFFGDVQQSEPASTKGDSGPTSGSTLNVNGPTIETNVSPSGSAGSTRETNTEVDVAPSVSPTVSPLVSPTVAPAVNLPKLPLKLPVIDSLI